MILDITAVPVVDTAVARHLLETVAAARLLGAEVLMEGLSTRTAITLVEPGLELRGVRTAVNADRGLMLLKRLVTTAEHQATRRAGFHRIKLHGQSGVGLSDADR